MQTDCPAKGQQTEAPTLPAELLEESPSVKLLYTWLLPQGEVNYSASELEHLLGISRKSAITALNRLRELGLVEDSGEQEERKRSRYKAKA